MPDDWEQYLKAAGGIGSQASGLASLASNIPGLESIAEYVPYLGSLVKLLKLGEAFSTGDPTSILTALPGIAGGLAPVAGSGALGAGIAAAAPALSTIGAFALPAAAAGYFATNDLRKDAERRANEVKEWQTAKRDLPTGLRQITGALGAHGQMGEDLSQLSDEQLSNLTGQTQTGMLALDPLGHSLMQLGAGEEFAGIPGANISKPQALDRLATPVMARDYMRQADEFSRRGLGLGGTAATAMHGSIYDTPEAQWAVNAPDPAEMLKSWGLNLDASDPRSAKINEILDAARTGTAAGGAIENVDIPNWAPGHYKEAFDEYVKNLMGVDTSKKKQEWGVYQGPNPFEYVPYSGLSNVGG
jgi:hypothetical protein